MPTHTPTPPTETTDSESSSIVSSPFQPAPRSRFEALRRPALLIVIVLAATVGVYFTFFASAANGIPGIVSVATNEIGTAEVPKGSNRGPACKYQGSGCPQGQGWCADFVSWVYKQAGYPFTGGADGGWRIGAALGVKNWFQAQGTWHARGSNDVPQPGDVVYSINSRSDHAAIVDHVDGTTLYTIDGNWSDAVSRVSHPDYRNDGTLVGWGRLKTPPSPPYFYLRNSNTTGPADETYTYGVKGDQPLECNWNGNSAGADTVAIFRPSTNTFYIRYSNTPGISEVAASIGSPGDIPICGDWNGDGIDTIGVFRPSTGTFHLRNTNTTGPGDVAIVFGSPGDIPLAGNWGGKGADGVGVFRPSTGMFYTRSNTGTVTPTLFGSPGDVPVIGDWDHTGTDQLGVFRPSNATFYLKSTSGTITSFAYGLTGDVPIAGDWLGNGTDTVGVYRE